MKKLLLALIISVSSISAAQAGGVCYSRAEAEAEQGIRIHSELMVIGLNCVTMKTSTGGNLYAEHRKFTAAHADLLATYEKILMAYLKRNGVANPEKQLHALRTDFANKISKDAAVMRPDKFCKSYAPRIEQVSKMDEVTFRKWAATPYPEYPVSKPLCDG